MAGQASPGVIVDNGTDLGALDTGLGNLERIVQGFAWVRGNDAPGQAEEGVVLGLSPGELLCPGLGGIFASAGPSGCEGEDGLVLGIVIGQSQEPACSL